MVILYEVTLYPNGSISPEVNRWIIWKAAYWKGETSQRALYVRYSHRGEPKRFNAK